METMSLSVEGMTCEHCARAVTEELEALPAVNSVEVALVPGGISTVTLVAEHQPSEHEVHTALAEAGDYRLVG